MNNFIIVLCVLGALACAAWALKISQQPRIPGDERGCYRKPRGFWKE